MIQNIPSNIKNKQRIKDIEEQIKTVYDPEFPIVDIFTLGLIYKVNIDEKKNTVHVIMTFTTPACPMADQLKEMTTEAVKKAEPKLNVELEITFDPMRNIDMVKDPDVKRMFE